ncbi:putative ribonuclease H-like domain-containing protein [Tanacetum coccineum]
MIGNKALLTDYQDINGGFVAFGRSTRGGKITGIGKIRTNKIDFEDVFIVKELKFNLFFVSQMCDKKNNAKDDTVDDDACKKTVQEPANEYDQSLKNVLDKMMDQEKEATEKSDANAYDDHDLETFNTPYAGQSVGAEADFKVEAMQEELLQFKIQKVWTLVALPSGKKAISTKWVYRNKKDERGMVFAPVSRVEAIRLFLAFASFMNFHVYRMDVKSAFLYGTIEEEVYVCQPPGFVDPEFPEKVYKVEKALYGLHQAPRA